MVVGLGLPFQILILASLVTIVLPTTPRHKIESTESVGKRSSAPYIDIARSPNISVSLGRTATLRCRTVNVVKKSVSWLRHKDVNLLSVGRYLYTKDARMRVMEDRGRGEWMLNIRNVKHSDAGDYECQVNTNPLLKHTVTLSVVEPYTEIMGDSPGSTLYIDIRSVLNLTCIVHSPEVPAAIFWKHNGQLLEVGDDGIQTVAGDSLSPTKSFLSLALTDTRQSGEYQCSPSNTGPVEVEVHIVQDKELPVGQPETVLQVSSPSSAQPTSALPFLVFLIQMLFYDSR